MALAQDTSRAAQPLVQQVGQHKVPRLHVAIPILCCHLPQRLRLGCAYRAGRREGIGQGVGILHADVVRVLLVPREGGERRQIQALPEPCHRCWAVVRGCVAGFSRLKEHISTDWGGGDRGRGTSRARDAAYAAAVTSRTARAAHAVGAEPHLRVPATRQHPKVDVVAVVGDNVGALCCCGIGGDTGLVIQASSLLDVAVVVVLLWLGLLSCGCLLAILHGATGGTSTMVVDRVLLAMVVVGNSAVAGGGCAGGGGGGGVTISILVPDMVAVAVGLVCRAHDWHWLVVLLLVLLVLLGIFVEGRWDVVQIFAKMPAAAFAVASFEGQVVALLGPQVLQSLLLAPAPGSSAGTEIGQDGLLELLKAVLVHPAPLHATLIVTQHSHGIVRVLGIYRLLREATGAGRTAFL